ncbi:MAG: magnesium chelatase [Chloroflexi bacterium]|nr:magnesium chelatase [Chloroflexota bacterium]
MDMNSTDPDRNPDEQPDYTPADPEIFGGHELEEDHPNHTLPPVRSLRELIDRVTGRDLPKDIPHEDMGIAETLPYPFLGLVGQDEMKLSLILSLINPMLGGVLLVGPRGTGKTTAVRSLVNLIPDVPRSLCVYGCTEADVEAGGMDAVCPDCARKFAEGKPLSRTEPARLVELPLNARLDDVIGGVDERSLLQNRLRLKKGILAQADQNLLYLDEVNLLQDDIIDAVLDAAAQGSFTVRRGPLSATYRSRFTLIGSMNPEEGNLRPQILDRFGLRVIIKGLEDEKERKTAYERTVAYRSNPHLFNALFEEESIQARQEIQAARKLVRTVSIPEKIARSGIQLIQQLKIDSLRAEITLFESAKAHAAADGRKRVEPEDLKVVIPMALRLRRSKYMVDYIKDREREDAELHKYLDKVITNAKP